MPEPLYDDPEFLELYELFPRQQNGLAGAGEWPDLLAMIPNVAGRSFLDLGCGFGWHTRWAAENGASRVVGLDASQKMLDRALATTNHPAVEYRLADLDHLSLDGETFDIVFSSLTLHYVNDLHQLFRATRAATNNGGSIVFNVEHPIMTGPTKLEAIDDGGITVWPVDRYADEGPRTRTWLVEGVRKHHRTVATWINALIDASYTIEQVIEWSPSPQQVADNPGWAIDRTRPPFLMVAARANH